LRDAQQAYDRAVNYLEFLQRDQQGIRQTQSKTFIETINQGAKKYVFQTKEFKMPANADWITEAENDVALKQAELDAAQRTYNSLKQGADAQDVAATQAKIDAAQSTIDTMSIIAPFNGEVLYVESKPNDVVNTDTSALSMANIDHLYIETQIDESDIANIKVGDPVTATLESMPGLKLTGKVAAVDSLGQEESGSIQYTVQIDVDKVSQDTTLPLGATANMTIEVKPATASLTVPITVIQNDSKGEYVLALQADGSTKRVDVVSSTIVGDRVVVTGDLKEGDSLTTSQKGNAAPRGLFGRGN
jgi:HlyD family secretion protein